jgi:hypothetical protein
MVDSGVFLEPGSEGNLARTQPDSGADTGNQTGTGCIPGAWFSICRQPNAPLDFSSCMYQYEGKEEFEIAFDAMIEKARKLTWLDNIYLLKHKWAKCYMIGVFSIRM